MRGTLRIVVVAALVGLVGLEVVMRFQEGRRCQDQTGALSTWNALYGWGHEPDASGWLQRCLRDAPEWRTFVRINHRGLPDREIPYERTAARRILVLGDSFTEAFEVDFEASFAKRLERALNGGDPPGTHVEVVNAGTSAWGTDNALLFYEAEGRRYHPDVVMLVFNTSNDVFENDRNLTSATHLYPDKPYFDLVDGVLVRENYPLHPQNRKRRFVLALYHWLQPRSAIVRRLATLPAVWGYLLAPPLAAPGGPKVHMWQVYLRQYSPTWREAWRITRGLVLRLRQRVEASGARFVVVVMNGREEISPERMDLTVRTLPDLAAGVDPDKPNRLITRFLARRGIATIPLLDGFRAAARPDGRPVFYEWDVHWTSEGHALAARLIQEALARLGLVETASPSMAHAGD